MAENGQQFNAETLEISTEDAGRRLVLPVVAERRMNMYPATENELESLSFINSLSIACFSVGAFLLSWPISIWIELWVSTPSQEQEGVFLFKVALFLLIVSIVFFGFGIYSIKKRRTIIETIKGESERTEG